MTVVVGAPDVDGLVETADDQLVAVVRDVRREVGRVAVGADEDVIFEFELVDVLLRLARLLQSEVSLDVVTRVVVVAVSVVSSSGAAKAGTERLSAMTRATRTASSFCFMIRKTPFIGAGRRRRSSLFRRVQK